MATMWRGRYWWTIRVRHLKGSCCLSCRKLMKAARRNPIRAARVARSASGSFNCVRLLLRESFVQHVSDFLFAHFACGVVDGLTRLIENYNVRNRTFVMVLYQFGLR